jgi:hypothetical protein
LLPAFSDFSGRLAPPNVKVGAAVAVDSAGFESAGFALAGLASTGLSTAIFSTAILSDEILPSEAAGLLWPGADTSADGGATSRAGAGALAAPLPDAGNAEWIAVLSVDGGFIDDSAGSADLTAGCIPALSIADFADAVFADVAAAATVVWI